MAVIRPLSSAMAGRPETVVEALRISAAGAIVAPAQGAGATVTVNAPGDLTVTLANPYAELLGHTVQVEGAAVPAAGLAIIAVVQVLSPSSIRIRTFADNATTPVLTAAAVAVVLVCSDSLVP